MRCSAATTGPGGGAGAVPGRRLQHVVSTRPLPPPKQRRTQQQQRPTRRPPALPRPGRGRKGIHPGVITTSPSPPTSTCRCLSYASAALSADKALGGIRASSSPCHVGFPSRSPSYPTSLPPQQREYPPKLFLRPQRETSAPGSVMPPLYGAPNGAAMGRRRLAGEAIPQSSSPTREGSAGAAISGEDNTVTAAVARSPSIRLPSVALLSPHEEAELTEMDGRPPKASSTGSVEAEQRKQLFMDGRTQAATARCDSDTAGLTIAAALEQNVGGGAKAHGPFVAAKHVVVVVEDAKELSADGKATSRHHHRQRPKSLLHPARLCRSATALTGFADGIGGGNAKLFHAAPQTSWLHDEQRGQPVGRRRAALVSRGSGSRVIHNATAVPSQEPFARGATASHCRRPVEARERWAKVSQPQQQHHPPSRLLGQEKDGGRRTLMRSDPSAINGKGDAEALRRTRSMADRIMVQHGDGAPARFMRCVTSLVGIPRRPRGVPHFHCDPAPASHGEDVKAAEITEKWRGGSSPLLSSSMAVTSAGSRTRPVAQVMESTGGLRDAIEHTSNDRGGAVVVSTSQSLMVTMEEDKTYARELQQLAPHELSLFGTLLATVASEQRRRGTPPVGETSATRNASPSSSSSTAAMLAVESAKDVTVWACKRAVKPNDERTSSQPQQQCEAMDAVPQREGDPPNHNTADDHHHHHHHGREAVVRSSEGVEENLIVLVRRSCSRSSPAPRASGASPLASPPPQRGDAMAAIAVARGSAEHPSSNGGDAHSSLSSPSTQTRPLPATTNNPVAPTKPIVAAHAMTQSQPHLRDSLALGKRHGDVTDCGEKRYRGGEEGTAITSADLKTTEALQGGLKRSTRTTAATATSRKGWRNHRATASRRRTPGGTTVIANGAAPPEERKLIPICQPLRELSFDDIMRRYRRDKSCTETLAGEPGGGEGEGGRSGVGKGRDSQAGATKTQDEHALAALKQARARAASLAATRALEHKLQPQQLQPSFHGLAALGARDGGTDPWKGSAPNGVDTAAVSSSTFPSAFTWTESLLSDHRGAVNSDSVRHAGKATASASAADVSGVRLTPEQLQLLLHCARSRTTFERIHHVVG